MSQAVLGWGRKNIEGSFKRNEARQARTVCTHTVPPRRSTEGLFILWLLYIVSAKFWNKTVVFWQTWSKNIWNKPDVASTKSSLMCHSHWHKFMSDCENKPLFFQSLLPRSPFGQMYVRSCVAVMLCGLHSVLCISLQSATVDIWSVGCIMAELLTGKPLFPGTDRILPQPQLPVCCTSAVRSQSWVQMERTDAHRSSVFMLSLLLTAVHAWIQLLMTAEALSHAGNWLIRRLELLVFANSRLKLLWYYTVTMQHSARQRTQLTCEQVHFLIGINQQCPDPSDVI